MAKSPKPVTRTPKKKYVLTVAWDSSELSMLEALEADMHIRRTQILKLLVADEFKRRGLRTKI